MSGGPADTAARVEALRRWVVPNGYAGGPADDKTTAVMVRLDDLRKALDVPSRPTPADEIARAWDEGYAEGVIAQAGLVARANPYRVAATDDETPR